MSGGNVPPREEEMQITAPAAQTTTDYTKAAFWIEKGLHAEAARMKNNVRVKVVQFFATEAEAQEFAAQFPKSNKVVAKKMIGIKDNGGHVGMIEAVFNFSSNGVTGERNETAIKRFRSFEKNLDKAGLAVHWTMPYAAHMAMTYADVEAHIA
ncbi:hypothetical protein SEA_KLIMBON_101 [Mycobacterium phage KlimbOn]|nr:hypothetical protein SEA_KLIMBON_101 [Mycobacterium phage KlimbOn]